MNPVNVMVVADSWMEIAAQSARLVSELSTMPEMQVAQVEVAPANLAETIREQAHGRLVVLLRASETPATEKPQPSPIYWVRTEGGLQRLVTQDIIYAEGIDNFVRIHTPQGIITTWLSLRSFSAQVGCECLVRIHKSFLINLNHTTQILPEGAVVGGRTLPISRTYREALMARLDPLILKKL